MPRTLLSRGRRTATSALVGLLASIVLLPMLASAPATASPAAPASVSSNETEFLTRLNLERQARGIPLLVSDPELAPTSRSWSSTMASRNALSHDPNLALIAALVEPAWRGVAENVGVGYSVKQLHDAFMGSAGHRANMLNASYNRVGIGVVLSGGKIWVTVRFLAGPAIAGSTGLGPPPPPPGVATVLAGDFDGDGNDDFLTYGPGSQADELWFGRDDRSLARTSMAVNGHYRPIAGDFDADGMTEILWYVPGSTADPLWNWNGSGWSATTLQVSGTYSPFVGDFDGDGADDVFWYGPGRAGDARWYGKAGGGFTSASVTVNGVYLPFVGDLDGQNGDDVFWYAPGSGVDYLWYANTTRGSVSSVSYRVNARYAPFTGDLDGNGTDDVFWYAPGSGADSVWYTSTVRGAFRSVSRTVTKSYLPAAGDFDAEGTDDVLWFSPASASGDPVWWGLRGQTAFTGSALSSG
jgi:uncharacterized protein YkwD